MIPNNFTTKTKQTKQTRNIRIKKQSVINIITSDGKTLSGKVKEFSRHSSGAIFLEIEKGGDK